MSAHVESPFCERCQKNQVIVNRSLAEYLPEEDHPDYAKFEKALPQYQAQLEERYPPVCENCIENVQKGIRDAGLWTKAEELRRKLDQSKKYQAQTRTVREILTLAMIWLGKWIYVVSVIVGIVWHGFGAIAYFDFSDRRFDWANCLSGAVFMREAHQSCVVSPLIRQLVFYALIGESFAIWWNPKQAQKMKHASGRMRGLIRLWIIRGTVLLINWIAYLALNETSVQDSNYISDERVKYFHYTHIALLAINIIACYIGWKAVTIEYISMKALSRPLDAQLPTAPRSNQTTPRQQHTTLLPDNTSFDSMAAGFASSFPSELNAYPPSPTLTATSYAATEDSDFTPYSNRKSSIATNSEADAMDWTPTHSRFASQAPSLIPFPQPSSPSPAKPPTTNIFKAGADQNPFRRRIPAAPKAAGATDIWRKPAWAPDPEERKRNFFEEDREMNKDLGMGLKGRGVPRAVEREARLFAPPKFKYDAGGYTGVKETGLEEGFNDLFSK